MAAGLSSQSLGKYFCELHVGISKEQFLYGTLKGPCSVSLQCG